MVQAQNDHQEPPSVLIVGAGLGGLLLAILFERSNTPYHIFERAAQVRPLGMHKYTTDLGSSDWQSRYPTSPVLTDVGVWRKIYSIGSAMTIGANIIPVFEQLGLLEEIESISLPCPKLDLYNSRVKSLGSILLKGHKMVTGYESLLFERPKFYDILRRHVPDHKISMSKKVLRSEEKDGRVIIHCADSTTYEGDILVGADGAYSGVRQSMYKQMEEKDILPKADLESFTIGYVTMVGVSEPKNPTKYSQLSENISHFSTVLGENNQSWTVVSVSDKRVCWGTGIQLPKSQAREQQFRNSEWGPESNEAMIAEFRDRPCPWGGTMGEIMDDTPKELISKVFLEEKVFKTWYHGRTVLIGDACHKMLPSAGQGAVNAMQDAVVLANCLYNMTDSSSSSITAAFQEYYRQRSDRAAMQVERSRNWGKIMSGHTWTERLIRHLILNYIPYWIQVQSAIKTFEYRPQIHWLPLAKERGTGRAHCIIEYLDYGPYTTSVRRTYLNPLLTMRAS